MSEDEKIEISGNSQKLVRLLWGIVVAVAAATGWGYNIQSELNALKRKTERLDQIAWYVEKIASKVGVETEPPR